jgi:hypothetical protein
VKLLRFLRVICLIGETATALGALLGVAALPFSEAELASQSARVGVFIEPGGTVLSMIAPFAGGGSFGYHQERLAGSSPPLGGLVVGPVTVRSASDQPLRSGLGSGILLTASGTNVTFERPEAAVAAFHRMEWPLAFQCLLTAATWIAILELLRRLFLAVSAGRAFEPSTLRKVYGIGGLLVGSSLVNLLTTAWVAVEMGLAVDRWVHNGSILVPSGLGSGISGIAAGIIILALAEVFRQGSRLAEEARLTV